MTTDTIRIGRLCSNKGCKRIGTAAKKVSDFWINLCDKCQGTTIVLDMDKVCAEK
jgi:hypothetical protein